MVKKFTLILFALSFFSLVFVSSVNAQSTNEKVAKRTEKFRQKIKSLGTGEKVKVVINTFDGNRSKGYISESNDNSFTVIDRTGNSKVINYGDVKQFSKQGNGSKLVTGIIIGAGAATVVTLLIIYESLKNN